MKKGGFSLLILSLLHSSLSLFAALPIEAPHAILMDFHSGAVLFEKEAHTKMYPSSMTKIMTIYLTFEALKSGSITLDRTFYVSKKARNQIGSRMFVEEGSFVPIEELIKGTIVSSGNDSSVVLAEGLAGDESVFALQMTQKATDLGAKNTNFLASHGLPNDGHYTTAYDLATIAAATIREFPKFYENYYSLLNYKYKGIDQYTHNTLLRQGSSQGDYTVDGLKTGFTDKGGYGLVFSAVKGGTRLIGVVNGLKTPQERIKEARLMLQWGFNQNKTIKLMSMGESPFSLPVEGGKAERVSIMSKEDIFLTYPTKVGKEGLNFKLTAIKSKAPIAKGDHVADLYIDGGLIPNQKISLYASAQVDQQSLVSSIFSWASNFFVTPTLVTESETITIVKNSLLNPAQKVQVDL